MLPPGITKVIAKDDLGATPAKCFRDTGIVLTNNKSFPFLNKNIQDFIIAHEAGHIVYDTDNEFLADDFAFKWCLSQGMGLKNCVFALTQVLTLPENNPGLKKEQEKRMQVMLNKALEYDYKINKNEKANPMNGNDIPGEFENHILGIAIGKKAQAKKAVKKEEKKEKKEQRQENRQDKKDVRLDKKRAKVGKIKAKGEAKVINANAKQTLAEQGKTRFGEAGSAVAAVATQLAPLLKPSVTEEMAQVLAPQSVPQSMANVIQPQVPPQAPSVVDTMSERMGYGEDRPTRAGEGKGPSEPKPEDDKSDGKILGMEKTTAIVVAVVVVVVLAVVTVFVIRRKRKGKAA